MDVLPVFVGFLLCVCSIGVVYSGFCDIHYTTSVSKTRSESYVGTCYYYTSCGFWGWSRCRRSKHCTKYRSVSYYEAQAKVRQGCCTGFTGTQCDIPVCTNCQNNAVCIAPQDCYCRPGSSGSTCTLAICSVNNDCYPGTCSITSGKCVCSSGFTGSSCSKILEGGSLRTCGLQFQMNEAGKSTTSFNGNCMADEYGIKPSLYSNTKLPSVLEMSYEVVFPLPGDLPPLPSEYMVAAPFGLINSYAELTMNNKANVQIWGPVQIPCIIDTSPGQNQPSSDNPHKSLNCHNQKYNWSHTAVASHKDHLNLKIVSQSGGYKEYVDNSNNVEKRVFTGSTTTYDFQIKFDLEPPKHCLSDRTCPANKPYACEFVPGVSKYGTTQLDFAGWIDNDSGLEEFRYTVYMMEVDSTGLLVERAEYVTKATLPVDAMSPYIDINYPGMYSAIFEAVDHTGNIVKARALFLHDNTSRIDTDDEHAVQIGGTKVIGSTYWITTTVATVTITWKNRYRNNFLHDNNLLAEVKPRTDVTFDDNYGLRTVSQISNTHGINRFGIAFTSEESEPSPGQYTILPPSVQQHKESITVSGNSVMYLHLVATDIVGNSKGEKFKIRLDDSSAIFNQTIMFTQNVDATISGKPYMSSLTIHVEDRESGIQKINYSVNDITFQGTDSIVFSGSQSGQIHSKYTTGGACATSGECYCVPDTDCFTNQQVIWINNCELKDLDGHSFRLDFNVANGAGLSWQSTESYEIGTLQNLKGIGYYPPPQNVKVIEFPSNVYRVNITWQYAPVCYTTLSVGVVYTAGSNTKTVEVPPTQRSVAIDGLRPLTEYTVTVRLSYKGGQEGTEKVTFLTGDDGHGALDDTEGGDSNLGIGVWIGAGIGALILLVAMVLATLIFIRWRNNKDVIPPALRNTTHNIRNRLSRNSHIGSQPGQAVSSITTNNRVYQRNPYEYDEPLEHGTKVKTYRVAYDGETEDNFYSYDSAEPIGAIEWKLTNDRVALGDPLPLAKGMFAEILKAKLKQSRNSIDVVAKVNKVGATDKDKTLMEAKMSFLSAVPSHENILKYIAAVPPPEGPMIILEYCEEGKLLKWLQKVEKITSDIEDQMNNFAEQVAKGMSHLHQNEIIHKRLGARNVLLTRDTTGRYVAKVTGFGPAKGDKASDIDEHKGDRVILKWMAPEQFYRAKGKARLYTKETDVWSYGIFLHEVYSKGKPPYGDMTDKEMTAQVKNGYRLPKDPDYTEFIYDGIMMHCWNPEPNQRPSFDDILMHLTNYFSGGSNNAHYAYEPGDLYQNQSIASSQHYALA